MPHHHHNASCCKLAACVEEPPHVGLCCCLQDKILQSMGRGHEVTVTNDGATILKSVYVDNPAAKVLQGRGTSVHVLQSLLQPYVSG
jgi:hypothetical protein